MKGVEERESLAFDTEIWTPDLRFHLYTRPRNLKPHRITKPRRDSKTGHASEQLAYRKRETEMFEARRRRVRETVAEPTVKHNRRPPSLDLGFCLQEREGRGESTVDF